MKLFKRAKNPDAPYYVKFMVRGIVHLWSTKTSDKVLAAKHAKSYRERIIAEQYHLVDAMKSRGNTPSFDDLFAKYKELPLRAGPIARQRAVGAMKRILAITEHDTTAKLSVLSAELALTYQQESIKAKENPVTTNARLRFSRALFSKQALVGYRAFSLAVPEHYTDGYCSVGMLAEPERLPEIPDATVVALAHARLAPFPDVYRAFLLAAYAGLRSGEIRAAKWSWIKDGVLYVGGRDFVAKSRKWRPIGLAPEVLKELEKGERVGDYIVGASPTITVVRRLPGMLRDIGFNSATPVHSLRRLFGSHVAAVSGLWGAQSALGHADPQTTAKHYARQLNMPAAVPMTPFPTALPTPTP